MEIIRTEEHNILDRRAKGQNNSRHNNRITGFDNKDKRTI